MAVVASVAGLGAVGGGLALRLHPETGIDTLINRGSDTFQATDRYHRMFGDDAVLVLVRGPLPDLVLTQDVERLLGMEGCISGNAPVGVKIPGGPNGPCGRLARSKPVQVVYGPGTFINEAVRELQVQFARRQQVEAQRERGALTAARKLAAAKGLG